MMILHVSSFIKKIDYIIEVDCYEIRRYAVREGRGKVGRG